jgi:hypothetical protein
MLYQDNTICIQLAYIRESPRIGGFSTVVYVEVAASIDNRSIAVTKQSGIVKVTTRE